MTSFSLSSTLQPNGSSTFSPYDWNNAALWLQGQVPDTPSAQVTLNNSIDEGYTIAITAPESISIGSMVVPHNQLLIDGSLTSAGSISIGGNQNEDGDIELIGGTLSAQSLHVNATARGLFGVGQVTVAGPIFNDGTIASGIVSAPNVADTLDLKAAYFDNTGTLEEAAGSTLIVETTSASGFANYVSGTLSGGTYMTQSGAALDLKTPGVIHSDAATLVFTGDGTALINSWDPTAGHYVSIESSLTLVTASGMLELNGGTYAAPGNLTVAGHLTVIDDSHFSAGGSLYITSTGEMDLQVAPGGVPGLSGSQTVTARQIIDSGLITADAFGGGVVTLDASVTGGGTILLGPAQSQFNINHQLQTTTAQVEITQSVTGTNLAYSDGTGTFILGAPGQFLGTFKNFQAGDSIILSGIDFSSVTGFSYSGNSLSVHENGTVIHFAFAGDHSTADFSLQAVPNGGGTAIMGVA